MPPCRFDLFSFAELRRVKTNRNIYIINEKRCLVHLRLEFIILSNEPKTESIIMGEKVGDRSQGGRGDFLRAL